MTAFRTAFYRRAVQDSPDLRRILALPRRTWTAEESSHLATELTAVLKTHAGTMSLRPIQAQALHDMGVHGGGFFPMAVGTGKTLTSGLAPYVLEARRPVLLLPASLVQKTEREFRTLSRHWRVPCNIRILSYEMLGRVTAAEELDRYKPDLVVADEAHRLKNKKAAVTRRVVRYMRENPGTKFVALSGTMMKNSLRDFAHLLRWSLKDGAPIPSHEGELDEWADALDENVNALQRTGPGALLKLCTPEQVREAADETQAARRGFQRRLLDTPGVVASLGGSVACSIYVRALEFKPNQATEDNFHTLRSKWETPDGWPISEAVEVWRHARELALGLHYVWDPRPPEEWLLARRNWAKFVRETLKHSRTLDSELQVANACKREALERSEFDAWTAIRSSFTPRTRAVWHDDAALKTCQAWMKHGAGIVWCEHTWFAEALSELTGAPYFGAQGQDRQGRSFDALADEVREGRAKAIPVIASIAANATGRNLQPWHRNLITSPPTGASTWEQLLGRTHRDGQTADEVTIDVLVACWEHFDAWVKAQAGAVMAQDTLGHTQKLLIADTSMPSEADVMRWGGARWSKSVAEKAPFDPFK